MAEKGDDDETHKELSSTKGQVKNDHILQHVFRKLDESLSAKKKEFEKKVNEKDIPQTSKAEIPQSKLRTNIPQENKSVIKKEKAGCGWVSPPYSGRDFTDSPLSDLTSDENDSALGKSDVSSVSYLESSQDEISSMRGQIQHMTKTFTEQLRLRDNKLKKMEDLLEKIKPFLSDDVVQEIDELLNIKFERTHPSSQQTEAFNTDPCSILHEYLRVESLQNKDQDNISRSQSPTEMGGLQTESAFLK